ncbi:MAG: PorV/PorQ family protein [Candidatus Eisenbacteria bacterium]|nr:PorV/PorQ family protein [Candidatus Eisenbacteria bacterium]
MQEAGMTHPARRRAAGILFVGVAFLMVFLVTAGARAEMTGMAWLANQPDTRSVFLGGAMVSHVADASATLWNPAGLAGMHGGEGMLSHSESIADIRREFAAVARNYGPVALGAHFAGVWTDNLDGYDAAGNPTGTFGYYGFTAGLAGGMHVWKGVRLGAGVKLLREAIDDVTADGWAVDLGAQWQSAELPLAAGVSVLNLGPDPSFIEESFPIPTMVQAGASYFVPFRSLSGAVLLSADVRSARDRDTELLTGIEYEYMQLVSLGLGYRSAADLHDLTFGFGFRRDRLRLQYAFIPGNDNLLGDSHRLGLGLKIW